MTRWIYFLKVNSEFFKIGSSTRLAHRIEQHSTTLTGNNDIDFLAAVKGTASDEKSLHRHFAEYAVKNKTELYQMTIPLAEYIRWLRDQSFVIIDVDSQSLDLPLVTFDHWQPAPGRSKTRAKTLLDGEFDFDPRTTTGDDFYTPVWIVGLARTVMGSIDLDPASHVVANEQLKASTFYSVHDNGLEKIWFGNVWLNPPFSQWKLWSAKIVSEFRRCNQLCVYVATRTLTARYFTPVLQLSNAICILTGRHANWGCKATDSPDDGHCILYFGNNSNAFLESFSRHGIVFLKDLKRCSNFAPTKPAPSQSSTTHCDGTAE